MIASLGGFRRVIIGVARLLREPTMPCQLCDPNGCLLVVTTTASMIAFSEGFSFFRLCRPPTSMIHMACLSRVLLIASYPQLLPVLFSLHQRGSYYGGPSQNAHLDHKPWRKKYIRGCSNSHEDNLRDSLYFGKAFGLGSGGAGCVSYDLDLATWSTLIREQLVWFACHSIGIRPVDIEERTETHFIKIFFVWLSANMNILSCVCLPYSTALVTPGPTIWFFVDSPRERWAQ